MYAKVIVLVFLAISQASAQQLPATTCGQVTIPQMTPLQLLNWYTWTLPGQIAASDCYTQYLQSVSNSWTNLYNAAYLAGPPQAISSQVQGTQQQAGQVAGQLPGTRNPTARLPNTQMQG